MKINRSSLCRRCIKIFRAAEAKEKREFRARQKAKSYRK